MWIADQWQDYELLDCGGGEKLERWDRQYLVRPDPQAIWETPRRLPEWKRANARYLRSQTGGGHWEKKALPAASTAAAPFLLFGKFVSNESLRICRTATRRSAKRFRHRQSLP